MLYHVEVQVTASVYPPAHQLSRRSPLEALVAKEFSCGLLADEPVMNMALAVDGNDASSHSDGNDNDAGAANAGAGAPLAQAAGTSSCLASSGGACASGLLTDCCSSAEA